jgi:hypothetical protein
VVPLRNAQSAVYATHAWFGEAAMTDENDNVTLMRFLAKYYPRDHTQEAAFNETIEEDHEALWKSLKALIRNVVEDMKSDDRNHEAMAVLAKKDAEIEGLSNALKACVYYRYNADRIEELARSVGVFEDE